MSTGAAIFAGTAIAMNNGSGAEHAATGRRDTTGVRVVQFFGDNTRFGAQRVELTAERFVDGAVEGGDAFPFGVAGMLPVATSRKKKGGYKTVYAFPFGEGEPPADSGLARELCAAVDFANLLLSEAADLTERDFGQIGALWMGVNEKGYSFTRVEQLPANDPNATPIHLRLETSDVPGAPDTLSAVMEYDVEGYLRNVLMTVYEQGGYSVRVMASIEYRSGEVLVQRVTETAAPDESGRAPEPVELYRRHRRPAYFDGDSDDYGYDEPGYDDRDPDGGSRDLLD